MNWGISLMSWGISLMYWVLVLNSWTNSKSQGTRVQLWGSVLSYVWDICLMYWIFAYVLKKIMSLGWNYGGVYCLGFWIFVLCMGY